MDRQGSFLEVWQALGGEPGAGRAAYLELARLYGEKGRFYHNMQHIDNSLLELEWVELSGLERYLPAMAIWYHDAIYDVRAKDNELKSAELAKERLLCGGIAKESGEAVYRLIMATCHGAGEAAFEEDERVMIDVDLAILGQSERLYDLYESSIRQEYSHVDLESYRKGRGDVLKGFLARQTIYLTEPFRERYERQARLNLKRALILLNQ